MKRKISSRLTLLFVSWIMVFTGCKKGEDGAPGKDGNANVTTRTFPINSWSNNSSFWYAQLNFPEITSANINSASIQAYWGTGNNTWVAIPYTYVSTTNYFMGYLTTVGLIEVRWTYNGIGLGNDPNSIFGAVQIKAVVIPPALQKKGINYSNYNEVKRAYNLKD